ncbi:BEN domain-containing protein 2 [Hyperolius riggenbachi]|uniref:BEN domain-containing protein 2 n=1 Tax=Hyperolius riggenbachi TaxID=752182 RepID=UPI0035A38590
MQSDVNTTEELGYGFPHKRRRVASMISDNTVEIQEQGYEGITNTEYPYDAEYDCASVMSDASYSGDHQPSLIDVLHYCQAMYDIVQKMDKKMDLLQRKVSELHHAQMKTHLKPRMFSLSPRGLHHIPQSKMRLQNLNQSLPTSNITKTPSGTTSKTVHVDEGNTNLQGAQAFKPVASVSVSREPQQAKRSSPPLPTIVSTHSLHPVITVTDNDVKIEPLPESTCASPSISASPLATSSVCPKSTREIIKEFDPVLVPHLNVQKKVITSEELPSSSVQPVPVYEFLGNPSRHIKVPGSLLAKARQKTQPKYAARYLVRALFPKGTLLSSAAGDKFQGLMALEGNKISAIREFLASVFPECDLGEYGKDWKTCTTNVNAMIRCLHLETKKNAATIFSNQTAPRAPEDSICLDSDDAAEEDNEAEVPQDQKAAQSTSSLHTHFLSKQNNNLQAGPPSIGTAVKHHSSDPIECFGEPWRNVQLPFSVIYIGKGKPRPELSARYLIRHLFPEDILVKSNVYGNLERGVLPLDSNRIGALRDFLQMNYPMFDLKECGHDWKACVAAINSTIRSLRHDQKKATLHTRKNTSLGS